MNMDNHRLRWQPTWTDRVVTALLTIAFIGQLTACFVFFDSTGSMWMVYAAIVAILAASVLGWRARVELQEQGRSQSAENWSHATVVVYSGVYGIVRHPMYLSFMLYVASMYLISQHWVSAACGAFVLTYLYEVMRQEEKRNLERFGDDYATYMQKVPRMNFIIGVLRAHKRGRV